MHLLDFLKRFRSLGSPRAKDRPGSPRVVEAALRSKRALDHLRSRQRRTRPDPSKPVASEPNVFTALATDPRSAPVRAAEARPSIQARVDEAIGATADLDERSFRLEPTPSSPRTPNSSAARRSRSEAHGAARSAAESAARRPATSTSTNRAPRTARPQAAPVPRSSVPRSGAARTIVPHPRPLPRFVVPLATLVAGGLGYAASVPLFERIWLPRVPLARVAVAGATVRGSESIARALFDQAGAPLDRIDRGRVAAHVLADPWIESAESFRLPTGTLVVRVVERRAIARLRRANEREIALLDPTGVPFRGAVEAGGALPLVTVPAQAEEAPLPAPALEILEELARHADLAGDPTALTLFLPGVAPETVDGEPAEEEPGAELDAESGFVLELGPGGPRALLGQTYLKRRIARLATLLAQRDAGLASARVIDLRYADRAVLRTGPASG